MTAPVVLVAPDIGVDDNGDTIEPVFPNWLTWYERVLSQWFTQDGDAKDAWCPRWRQHPLAAAAVDALWRVWELANVGDAAAMATFLAHQCFPTMRELMDGECFTGCTPERHRPTNKPLP